MNYVADTGDITLLFSAGSFNSPTIAGDYEWTPKNDTDEGSGAVTASGGNTKRFKYSGAQIGHPLSFMGVNTTIRLEKQS